jgi:hypothetical protein
LVPFAAVSIIFFVVSKYFIISEWFQLRIIVVNSEGSRYGSGINFSREDVPSCDIALLVKSHELVLELAEGKILFPWAHTNEA